MSRTRPIAVPSGASHAKPLADRDAAATDLSKVHRALAGLPWLARFIVAEDIVGMVERDSRAASVASDAFCNVHDQEPQQGAPRKHYTRVD
jgi:hypothetical protein